MYIKVPFSIVFKMGKKKPWSPSGFALEGSVDTPVLGSHS